MYTELPASCGSVDNLVLTCVQPCDITGQHMSNTVAGATTQAAKKLTVLHPDVCLALLLNTWASYLTAAALCTDKKAYACTPATFPLYEGVKSMQANRACWIYIARLSTEYGLTCRKSVRVCVCAHVCFREWYDWGMLAVCIELISFSHSFYEAKLMQRYTTPRSRVLLHMIKSLPLSLSLNYLFLSSLLLLSLRLSPLRSSPISLTLIQFIPFTFLSPTLSFSNPPAAPTSLSDW